MYTACTLHKISEPTISNWQVKGSIFATAAHFLQSTTGGLVTGPFRNEREIERQARKQGKHLRFDGLDGLLITLQSNNQALCYAYPHLKYRQCNFFGAGPCQCDFSLSGQFGISGYFTRLDALGKLQ